MVDLLKVQMTSSNSSLEVWKEGSGSFVIPATSSNASHVEPILHGFGSDELIWQVGATLDFGTSQNTGVMTPWGSSDGRTRLIATLDDTNLYITGLAQTVGSPTVNVTVNYTYRLLIP